MDSQVIDKKVLKQLPPSQTQRWVPSRKFQVVSAIRGNLLSVEQACLLYGLTQEELHDWILRVETFGVKGLRTTKIKEYRMRLNIT